MAVRPQHTTPVPLAAIPALAGAVTAGGRECAVTGITLDSRQVRPGDLYAALPGAATHGARFAAQAAALGARAILTDPTGEESARRTGLPVVTVADPRAVLGRTSAQVYGNPAEDLTVIGVTGTNGKTTMTHLLAASLGRLGRTTGVVGTIGIRIADEVLPSSRTTPEAPDVHALLAVMRERGVDCVAMEVSSHALVLGRVDGMVFDVAVFTNLSQDHLDFHNGMDDYFAAKADLFAPVRSRRGVVCTDDEWGRALVSRSGVPVWTYGLIGHPDWRMSGVVEHPNGSWSAAAEGPGTPALRLSSRLPGQFNRANALGALAALTAAGEDSAAAADGIASCNGVPGRMEPVGDAPFAAFVDYAHTPDAVSRAIESVRSFCSGRVLVAVGCGGDRDSGKRPLMGRAAADLADLVVITDDNPRSEDPARIRAEVLAGARRSARAARVAEVADRGEAIRHLVAAARPGDAVLVLGKGHETGQEVAGVVTPFDDRIALAQAIAEIGASA